MADPTTYHDLVTAIRGELLLADASGDAGQRLRSWREVIRMAYLPVDDPVYDAAIRILEDCAHLEAQVPPGAAPVITTSRIRAIFDGKVTT